MEICYGCQACSSLSLCQIPHAKEICTHAQGAAVCDIRCSPLPVAGREDPEGKGKSRGQNHRLVWVGCDLTDPLIPALPWAGTPFAGAGCSECFGESAVGDQAGCVLQPGPCGVSLKLLLWARNCPTVQKDIYIPSAGWWGLAWCLYHAGSLCQKTFELWCLKVKIWDGHMRVEKDSPQNRDEQALASRWDPSAHQTRHRGGTLGRGNIKTQKAMRGPQGDPGKQHLALPHCTGTTPETPLSWALGQSLPMVPAGLPSLQRPGPGKPPVPHSQPEPPLPLPSLPWIHPITAN